MTDYIKQKKGRFDLQDVFFRYTLEGIGQIAFGINLGLLPRSVGACDACETRPMRSREGAFQFTPAHPLPPANCHQAAWRTTRSRSPSTLTARSRF